ncbi:hypothetical protein F4780DRAFT_562859 [Xylariomycetidae sp. FL0641]|nr:hypothetical protein F4780DRAFT_562859 [Xylariomycetidae sp. FL0641]
MDMAPRPTGHPSNSAGGLPGVRFRDITTAFSTCGYRDGDPSRGRSAAPGYDCRVDTTWGIWGFCPNTVAEASDCGMAGACIDSAACSDGCGQTGNTELTTYTCADAKYCSTVLLDLGVDQIYPYIACGGTPTVETLLAEPTSSSTSSSSGTVGVDTTPSTAPLTSSALNVASPTSSTTSDSGGSTSNTGAIVGGILGGLALICGTILAVVFMLRRHRKRPDHDQSRSPVQQYMATGKYNSPSGIDPRSQTGEFRSPSAYPSELQAP